MASWRCGDAQPNFARVVSGFSVVGQTPHRRAQSELAPENRRLPPKRPNAFRRCRRRPHWWTQRPSHIAESPRLQGRATLKQVISTARTDRRDEGNDGFSPPTQNTEDAETRAVTD